MNADHVFAELTNAEARTKSSLHLRDLRCEGLLKLTTARATVRSTPVFKRRRLSE
jgi:hypothetical protein